MESRRSFLFVTIEGGGNVPAVLGLVRRLAARGHRVRVLTEPCLRDAVEAAGAHFTAFTRYFARTSRTQDLVGDSAARTPLGGLRRVFDNIVFGPARVTAEETTRAIKEERPDVVVADLMMPGALVAAEAAGVPRAIAFHTPEYLPGPGRPAAGPGLLPRTDLIGRLRDALVTRVFLSLLRRQLAPFNEARRACGLPSLATAQDLLGEFHRADLRLIQTSRAFDFPITPAPPNVRYIGATLDDPDWAREWQDPWANTTRDARPLVVASLSSTFQNQRGVLQRIIAALGTLDVRALITLGPTMARERFDVPDNVITVSVAPHSAVFPHAAAVITHGGHGTVMRALAHGVPVLCLPMGRDQDDNAARVVAHGVGLRLKRSASPPHIARAVRRLLEEPGCRNAAQRLGRIIREDAAAERGVAELESLAYTLRPRNQSPATVPLEKTPHA